tara:strand:- start:233 stop:481 length:249 start_codon:yes stop_codon:yes gene_type:complete
MGKQKLSAKAAKDKADRDLAAAKTTDRKKKKAENQVLRRKVKKEGFNLFGLDFDHEDNKFESIKRNRGNDGNGTRKEGKRKR